MIFTKKLTYTIDNYQPKVCRPKATNFCFFNNSSSQITTNPKKPNIFLPQIGASNHNHYHTSPQVAGDLYIEYNMLSQYAGSFFNLYNNPLQVATTPCNHYDSSPQSAESIYNHYDSVPHHSTGFCSKKTKIFLS